MRRFDEGDGLAEVAAIGGQDALFVGVEIDLARHASAGSALEVVEQVDDCIGDHRARREDRRGAGGAQLVEVLRRDHATDDDHDVVAPERGQLVTQLRARA